MIDRAAVGAILVRFGVAVVERGEGTPMKEEIDDALAAIEKYQERVLRKLAFQTGIPKEALEGYLEAKD